MGINYNRFKSIKINFDFIFHEIFYISYIDIIFAIFVRSILKKISI